MLKQEWNRLIIAFVGVGLFFIFVLAIFFSEEFQECYNAENCSYFDNQYECEPPLPHGVFRRAAECTWDVIHSNAEPILAVFTIVLAIFTFALWRATLRLAEDASTANTKQDARLAQSLIIAKQSADAAKESADVSREILEFERPWVFINIFPGIYPADGMRHSNRYLEWEIANHGRMPAILDIVVACDEICAIPTLPVTRIPAPTIIGPGEQWKHFFNVNEGIRWVASGNRSGTIIPELPERNILFLWAIIQYKDLRNNSHVTSYCWQFDPVDEKWMTYYGKDKADNKCTYLT